MADDLERLIQDRLDGEGSAEDERRLRETLDRDPTAVDRLRRSEVLFDALRSMEMVEPPPDLVTGAVAAIERQAEPSRPRRRQGSRLSLAFTFAAGLIVGGLTWLAMERVAFDGLPLGGTVPVSRDRSAVERRRIPLPEGEVLLEGRGAGHRALLRIETRATAGHRVRVAFDPASLTLVSFRRETPHGAAEPLVLDPRHLELQAAPAGVYTLEFQSDRTPAPVEVSVEGPAGWVSERVFLNPRSGSRPRPPNER